MHCLARPKHCWLRLTHSRGSALAEWCRVENACVRHLQANPFNKGLDEEVITSTIAKAKQRLDVPPSTAHAGSHSGNAEPSLTADAEGSHAAEAVAEHVDADSAASSDSDVDALDVAQRTTAAPSAATGSALTPGAAAATEAPASASVAPGNAIAAQPDSPTADASLQARGSTATAAAAAAGAAADSAAASAAAAAEAAAAELAAELAALTGQPRDEDSLVYAVPMSAPYDALAKFKHRVKVTPGGQKKGKAARQALELISRSAACSDRCALGLRGKITDCIRLWWSCHASATRHVKAQACGNAAAHLCFSAYKPKRILSCRTLTF